jgi:predicted enzyme related to lactoylglutathione lyase
MRWIHVSFDVPEDAADVDESFWQAVLGWELGPPWKGHPEFRSLRPPKGDGYAHVQRIDGPLGIHFDVGVDDVGAAAARLVAIGATEVDDFDIWRVMRSPGGLAFCLVPGGGDTVPPAAVWEDGHRSRLVQLCIDSPPDLHDAEIAFWRAATGWRYVAPSTPDEYGGKLFPPQPGPVQLLFQRLGDDDPGTTTRVHIDLGADDVDAEVRRVESLGARRRYEGEGWIQLTDPSGMPFCVTRNSPD